MSLYSALILADSPSLYWRLGESSGTNANDETANNRDGTYTGSCTLAQPGALLADPDTAVDLPGGRITSTYAAFGNGTVRSFECWLWRDTHGSNDVIFGGTGTDHPFCRLGVNQDVIFDPDITGAGTPTFGNNSWPGDGQWGHFVLVFNETSNALLLYVNGVQNVVLTATSLQYSASPGNLVVGARLAGSDPFDGKIDEFAVYEYALTAAQVKAHFYAGRRRQRSRLAGAFAAKPTLVRSAGAFTEKRVYTRVGGAFV